jgi:hypothetical protein
MESLYIIGIVAILLWIASFWFYFRSSNAQDELHERIESLNASLDSGETE